MQIDYYGVDNYDMNKADLFSKQQSNISNLLSQIYLLSPIYEIYKLVGAEFEPENNKMVIFNFFDIEKGAVYCVDSNKRVTLQYTFSNGSIIKDTKHFKMFTCVDNKLVHRGEFITHQLNSSLIKMDFDKISIKYKGISMLNYCNPDQFKTCDYKYYLLTKTSTLLKRKDDLLVFVECSNNTYFYDELNCVIWKINMNSYESEKIDYCENQMYDLEFDKFYVNNIDIKKYMNNKIMILID